MNGFKIVNLMVWIIRKSNLNKFVILKFHVIQILIHVYFYKFQEYIFSSQT